MEILQKCGNADEDVRSEVDGPGQNLENQVSFHLGLSTNLPARSKSAHFQIEHSLPPFAILDCGSIELSNRYVK